MILLCLVWLSLASEFQNQINALPAPPLLPNPSSDGKLKTVRSPKAIDYDDYDEDGAETDYDDDDYDAVIIEAATGSSVVSKAALTQRLIKRSNQRSKKVLDGISDLIFKFICSLLEKRTEFKIEPIYINIPLWTLK